MKVYLLLIVLPDHTQQPLSFCGWLHSTSSLESHETLHLIWSWCDAPALNLLQLQRHAWIINELCLVPPSADHEEFLNPVVGPVTGRKRQLITYSTHPPLSILRRTCGEQLNGERDYYDHRLVYLRCGRSLLGQDEEVPAFNEGIRVAVQL